MASTITHITNCTAAAPAVRIVIVSWRVRAIVSMPSTHTTNHGSWRGLSTMLPSSSAIISDENGVNRGARATPTTTRAASIPSTSTVRCSRNRPGVL